MVADKSEFNGQVEIIVKRHNFLVEEVARLESEFFKKDKELDFIKTEIDNDIGLLKNKLKEVKLLIEKAEAFKKFAIKDFKDIIKKDSLVKVQRRIDDLGYETFMYRDEFYRLLDRYNLD